jgi:sulfur carrier protein ThiS
MKIILDDGTIKEVNEGISSIEDILKKMKINPVEVIVSKNGRITSELDFVESEDQIRVIRIIHGG